MLAARLPKAMFGLEPTGRWNLDDVLELMAERVGVSPDPPTCAARTGSTPTSRSTRWTGWPSTWPGPPRDRSRVLLATGHPAGLLVVHHGRRRRARSRRGHGAHPGDGFAWQSMTRWGKVDRHIRYVGGVAVASDMGNLNHTHSAAADARRAR